MTVLPGTPAPELKLKLSTGENFDLHQASPEVFTMLVFYRGYHCGFCRRYRQDLNTHLDDFRELGVDVLCVSCDTNGRAQKTVADWGLSPNIVASEMTFDAAREWGLYVSTGIKDDQPSYFTEPGLFLVRPDATVYGAYVQSLPWARPRVEDLLHMIDFAMSRNKPPRGEVGQDVIDTVCTTDACEMPPVRLV